MAGGPGSYVFGEDEKKELMDVIEGKHLFRYGSEADEGFVQKVVGFEMSLAYLGFGNF